MSLYDTRTKHRVTLHGFTRTGTFIAVRAFSPGEKGRSISVFMCQGETDDDGEANNYCITEENALQIIDTILRALCDARDHAAG